MLFASAVINAVKNYNKTTADLDPFGGRYTPQETRARSAQQRDFHSKMMRDNDRSNNKSAGTSRGASRGPTAAEQVASARAAEKAAMKKKGKARRKKYEAAQTMAKKMKLIFLD